MNHAHTKKGQVTVTRAPWHYTTRRKQHNWRIWNGDASEWPRRHQQANASTKCGQLVLVHGSETEAGPGPRRVFPLACNVQSVPAQH